MVRAITRPSLCGGFLSAMVRAEPVAEVSRQIGSSVSEASVCLQPLSHDDKAMPLTRVSKRVSFATRQNAKECVLIDPSMSFVVRQLTKD
jgi:hypothetical protein